MMSKHNEPKEIVSLLEGIELKPIPLLEKQDKEKTSIPTDIITLANTPRNYVIHRTLKPKTILEDKDKKEKKSDRNPINILCFGCHGNLELKARLVAEQLAQAVEKDQILFIVVTGDNVYPKGVSSPNDKKFISYFYDKYLSKYPAMKKKCFFIALGNHDHNLRNYIGVNPSEGIAVAANEVAHTFLDENQEFDPKKLEYLSGQDIDLDVLEKEGYHWVMPSRYYALHHQESNAEFFFLDSNTYLHEYCELQKINAKIDSLNQEIELTKKEVNKINELKEKESDYKKYILRIYESFISSNEKFIKDLLIDRESNQAYWFKKLYTTNPGTRKIIIQHHPLYTVGKRAKESDANLYLTDQEIAQLKALFNIERNCDFIVTSSLNNQQLETLPGSSKSAYILTAEEKFYHFDKIKNDCVEIKVNDLALKRIKDKLEISAIPKKDVNVSKFIKTLSSEELTRISLITGHKQKKLIQANYNDMIKMAFKKEGILSNLDLVIHSHDHGTSLFYDSEFNPQGEMIKKSFCQLTVGGGGGEFQEMKEFSEIRKIPIYCGFGSCTMTLLDDEIRFRLNTVKSPDVADWHSQGKSWYFSNKTTTPLFDWSTLERQSEKELYLLVRQLILEGCYHYYDSFEQSKSGQNKFFRSIDSMAGNYGSVGLSRALNVIGVMNNPAPTSISSMLIEAYKLLDGSTILLDRINQQFKNKKFKVIATEFTVRDFVDFVKKYEAIIQQYHKMFEGPCAVSLFKSKQTEECKDPMSFKLVPF